MLDAKEDIKVIIQVSGGYYLTYFIQGDVNDAVVMKLLSAVQCRAKKCVEVIEENGVLYLELDWLWLRSAPDGIFADEVLEDCADASRCGDIASLCDRHGVPEMSVYAKLHFGSLTKPKNTQGTTPCEIIELNSAYIANPLYDVATCRLMWRKMPLFKAMRRPLLNRWEKSNVRMQCDWRYHILVSTWNRVFAHMRELNE